MRRTRCQELLLVAAARRRSKFLLHAGRDEVEGTGVATWGHNPDDWAAERPLILALFKHNAFEQQQHDAWQRAVLRVRDAARKGRCQLWHAAASNTHSTHFGLEVLCALNAAITPAKYDHRRQRYKPHHAPLLELC
jgi:hypothetical protein